MGTKLEIEFAGMQFLNPFLLASAPPTRTGDMIERAFEAGWGGAVIKTLTWGASPGEDLTPRIQAIRHDGRTIGFSDIELGSSTPIDQWLEQIVRLKRNYPDHRVIASLLFADSLVQEQWQGVARQCEQAGADGLELNLSCAHGVTEKGGGAALGTDRELIAQVVGWVRQASRLPILAKMPAAVDSFTRNAEAAKKAGADAISAINGLPGLAGIDIRTFMPAMGAIRDGRGSFGSLSGPAIKPVALRCVAQTALEVKIPLSGIGGVYTWQDAVEFFLAGAGTVQVCSAVMQHGYGIVQRLCSGVETYLETMGFSRLADITGLALSHFAPHRELRRDNAVARCDEDKCRGCGLCVASCRDSGFQAIHLSSDRIARIDAAACDGCGLCTQVCPVPECLTLTARDAIR